MIYHMCPAETWAEAVAAGRYTGTADDRHRAGQGGLLLIAVDPTRLGERLRWEASRGGALFPHLYGPLHPSEISSADPLPLGPDGEHSFPPLR
jgi:uncharacterized protein (DUF952 family)